MVGQALFQSPQQGATPPGFTPPQEAAQFHMPPSHYNNPVENVMAATRYLANAPIHGNTPADQGARDAIELLKAAVAQHAQYSYLHETPRSSGSRQAESLAPAASSSHHQPRGQPDP